MHSFSILAAVVLTSMVGPTFVDDKGEGAELVVLEAIDAGIRRWREQLSVKCNFEFQQGVAESLEKALVGDFVVGTELREDRANCYFAKKDSAVLYRFLIEGKSDYDPVKKTGSWSSFQLSVANDIQALQTELQELESGEMMNGALSFINLNGRLGTKLHPEIGLTKISPFVVTGVNLGSLFRPLIDSNLFTFSSSKTGKTLEVLGQLKNGKTTKFVLDNSGRYPLLLSITRPDKSAVIELSDYVDVGNGCMFPAKVVVSSGPHVNADTGENIWIGRIWKSSDIGETAPIDADFELEFAPESPIRGLLNPRVSINALEIFEKDLATPSIENTNHDMLDAEFESRSEAGSISLENPLNANSQKHDRNRLVFLVGFAVIVTGGALYFFGGSKRSDVEKS